MAKGPTFQLPKDALARVNLGQAFAEYDKLLAKQDIFVMTPALRAAEDAERSRCFYVGRRGTGKTAITLYLTARKKNAANVHPKVVAGLDSLIDIEELRDPRERHFRSLEHCFRRAIADEAVATWLERKEVDFRHFPAALNAERNLICDHDFDLRALTLAEEHFDALHKNREKEWLKLMGRTKLVLHAVDELAASRNLQLMVLIDRLDDTWDGTDKSVLALMALMHSCIELDATMQNVRPLLFLRENVYERVRAIDPEFARLETCVVSLDWTKELLHELVERRLRSALITKPALGSTWQLFFDKIGEADSYEHVFSFCQHRPRDILTYCAFAVESAQGAKRLKVSAADFTLAERKFSSSRLKDLSDEYEENFPQLQLVIQRFHGLGTEFTLHAISQLVQKLLADNDVQTLCKPWFANYVAPHRFIELLFSIGFVGVRNGNDLEFRGVGAHSTTPPAIDAATSTIVVHPTYRQALNLRERVVNTLDDVVLQTEGIAIELPEFIPALKDYHEKLNKLLNDVDAIPHGHEFQAEYEDLVGDVMRLCFFRTLRNPEAQVRDVDGKVRRDWVAANVAEQGFWNIVRDKYGAVSIPWECKNYANLHSDDFHQCAYYMTPASGTFCVLCFRGEMTDEYFKHIKRISHQQNGMVLGLVDKDLRVFIRQALNGKVKESHIFDLYHTTVRKIS